MRKPGEIAECKLCSTKQPVFVSVEITVADRSLDLSACRECFKKIVQKNTAAQMVLGTMLPADIVEALLNG